jgi:7,8-dihydro-6-hydroxymethylpterin-pyrophosphokinase
MVQDHERKILILQTQVGYLQSDVLRLKDELAVYQAAAVGANKKMDALLAAIVGDESLKTKGLMQRIESIEVVTDMVKELKWKAAGGLIVIGWAMASGYWVLQHFFH